MFFLACGLGCDGSHQNQAWTSCYMGSLDYSCSLQLLSPCCVVLPFSPVAWLMAPYVLILSRWILVLSTSFVCSIKGMLLIDWCLFVGWGGEKKFKLKADVYFSNLLYTSVFNYTHVAQWYGQTLWKAHYAFKQSCVQSYLGFSLKLLLDYALLFSTIPSKVLSAMVTGNLNSSFYVSIIYGSC